MRPSGRSSGRDIRVWISWPLGRGWPRLPLAPRRSVARPRKAARKGRRGKGAQRVAKNFCPQKIFARPLPQVRGPQGGRIATTTGASAAAVPFSSPLAFRREGVPKLSCPVPAGARRPKKLGCVKFPLPLRRASAARSRVICARRARGAKRRTTKKAQAPSLGLLPVQDAPGCSSYRKAIFLRFKGKSQWWTGNFEKV